jgi:alpha-beta hydrolase superfamily lysophospholipase
VEELEAWLQGKERLYDDLVPGAEKRVVWTSTAGQPSEWSVVYLHGFSATRQELAPVPERVAAHLRANLYEGRLTGHGRPGRVLGQAEAEDWLRDYREAITIGRRLGRRVVFMGCSTGATLDAYAAAAGIETPDVHIWVSPNFGPQDGSAELLLYPWAQLWVPWVAGAERRWEPVNEEQGRYWTTRYPVRALFPMQALVEAARHAALQNIRSPTLILHSVDDPVVRPDRIANAAQRLGAETKKRITYEGVADPHVLAGRILSPGHTDRVVSDVTTWLDGL